MKRGCSPLAEGGITPGHLFPNPSGSTATLSNPGTVNPAFTPNVLGNYVLQLAITDAAGLSSAPAKVIENGRPKPGYLNRACYGFRGYAIFFQHRLPERVTHSYMDFIW